VPGSIKLRPAELLRLINSTPLGSVLHDRQLYRHRLQAGYQIGDDRGVDLLAYIAWLHDRYTAPRTSPVSAYEAQRERAAARIRAISRAGREIGPLPPVADPERRDRCGASFQAFCETYFPRVFYLPWSVDHLRMIARIEQVVRQGGQYAVAMPRGSGKTSLCRAACLWAALYGYRRFIVLIGPTVEYAASLLNDLRTELETNNLLAADFPEICMPIRALEGITHRCRGQLYQGQRTYVDLRKGHIALPWIPGAPGAGAVIVVAGITGQIRGLTHQRPDGETVRPDIVLIDDPQTDESARSPSQCAAREAIISGAVLGLAGPGRTIAALMPCTVICPGDLADTLLDRQRHPEWQGERFKLLYSLPKNMELWRTYAELRRVSLQERGDISLATEFYREHQAEMDEGAVVAWPERYLPDEISAVQHAMNLLLRDESAFWAEYQNEPLVPQQDGAAALDPDVLAQRLSRIPRGVAPTGTTELTAFIDVHQDLLYWIVVAWTEDGSSYVIDYGTWPKQARRQFTMATATRRLLTHYPSLSLEAALYAGLTDLCSEILGREWRTEADDVLRVGRCLIDANWGQATDLIYRFCRESVYAPVLLPSHGRFVGASSRPFSEYQRRRGDRIGTNWRITTTATRRARAVQYDTNYWKSWVASRLRAPLGQPGCMVLFGDDPTAHTTLVEHLTAEYPVLTEARGRRVEEWRLIPGRENHWWDALVGAAVAASIQGVPDPQGASSIMRREKQKRSLAEYVRPRHERSS